MVLSKMQWLVLAAVAMCGSADVIGSADFLGNVTARRRLGHKDVLRTYQSTVSL
jgi:hypothetical protein